MTIAILPARLANQIAAGEVVERPASVIKELVENSLDAGATAIQITVDKGGVKKIKITDNGCGIAKDELALALSRHATSKIKNLSDLEAIGSLGFRGEALASISSVSRLTLTSKPLAQDTAWQASAEGRDMAVNVTPAAHPEGTSIEVLDLFFNTPARRKFLRTEKTEFNHIDEVVRRIALAHFTVSFTLTHNGKVIRQYRAANTHAQHAKRVARVCGPKFIDHAIEVNCEHDNMKLSGWVAKPSFARNQNDLCYSYVNGRMMRDKLINHAIRQAYDSLLPADTYPAFVLFLEVDYREVDVNVHPAKHEVRFHQSRYVHDFIYSICNKALLSINENEELFRKQANSAEAHMLTDNLIPEQSYQSDTGNIAQISQHPESNSESVNYQRPDYVTPLQHVNDVNHNAGIDKSYNTSSSSGNNQYKAKQVSPVAVNNYASLLTPIIEKSDALSIQSAQKKNNNQVLNDSSVEQVQEPSQLEKSFFLHYAAPGYGVFKHNEELRLLSLFRFSLHVNSKIVADRWLDVSESDKTDNNSTCLISQPLLLPVIVSLSKDQMHRLVSEQAMLTKAGIAFVIKDKQKVQIRQFPALLRDKDVTASFLTILDMLSRVNEQPEHKELANNTYYQVIAKAMQHQEYTSEQAENLIRDAIKLYGRQFSNALLLNSTLVDLTSSINKLN